MSIDLELTGHDKDLGGGFIVRRLLPSAKRQGVGPFIFFDHFGPVTVHPQTDGHDVRPHPHIGLATVTYLFEGAIMHRDSLGSVQRIEAGAINWMTAGSGIVHSERQPEDLKGKTYVNHGIQLWVALPLALEETEPRFEHTPSSQIPSFQVQDAQVRVLIGQAFDHSSPVGAHANTTYLDVALPAGGAMDLPPLAQELGVYVVSGEVQVDGQPVAAQTLAVLTSGQAVRLQAGAQPAQLMVLGGDPMDGHRFISWNFVSSSKERILQAGADWEAQRMGQVPGETEFIPLPPPRQ